MTPKYILALKIIFAVLFAVFVISLTLYILAYIGMLWFLFNVFIAGD